MKKKAEEEFSYNKTLEEVQKIMQQIESGEMDVDLVAKEIERATILLQKCKNRLQSVDDEIQKLIDSAE